jgi:hypothetical protein
MHFYFHEASVEVSKQIQVLHGGDVSPTTKPQPGEPGYPFLFGSFFDLSGLAALPVAVLLLA